MNLEQQYNSVQLQLGDANAHIIVMKEQMDKLDDELSFYKTEWEHAKDRIQEQEKELDQAKLQLADARVEIDTLEDANRRANALIAKMADEVQAAKQIKESEITTIGRYNEAANGERDWWSGGCWLYPGDIVAVLEQKKKHEQKG